MKIFTQINENNKILQLNKTQLYLLGIPYSMYKEYGQYKEDWKSLSNEDIQKLEKTQEFLNDHMDDKTLKISYGKLNSEILFGIKKICQISLNHQSDLDKDDKNLYKEILNTIYYEGSKKYNN